MDFQSSRSARPQPKSTIPAKRSAADAQEDAWVADEDRFVLKQAKKKALIRVRGGRAEPIDLLAVTLRALDATKNGFDSDDDDEEIPMVDPEGVLEGLDDERLRELEKGIDTYLALEQSRSNRDFWNVRRPRFIRVILPLNPVTDHEGHLQRQKKGTKQSISISPRHVVRFNRP